MRDQGWASLTDPERRVVELVMAGFSNPQIGERLELSRWTVKTHLRRIFEKLGVTNRSQLAVKAALWPRPSDPDYLTRVKGRLRT